MYPLSSYSLLSKRYWLQVAAGVLLAVAVGWLTARQGLVVPGLLLALAVVAPFLIALFHQPRLGVVALVTYCFTLFILVRETGGLPAGLAVDGLLVATWVAVAFNYQRFAWANIKTDLGLLGLLGSASTCWSCSTRPA